jgi:hypothetical protein
MKKMDCDEPHLALNEKPQPIEWREMTNWCIGGCWFTTTLV